MRKSPIQRRLHLGVLYAVIGVLALASTGVFANSEDMHNAAGCGGVPMPELSTWAGLISLLACCLYAALRQKRNAN